MLACQRQTQMEEGIKSKSYRYYTENGREQGEASEILSGFLLGSRVVR